MLWGGTALVDAETGTTSLYYRIEIDASDETTAQEIEKILKTDYSGTAEFAPWVRFDGGQEIDTAAWERGRTLHPLYRTWLSKFYEIRFRAAAELPAHKLTNPLRDLPPEEQHRIARMGHLSSMIQLRQYGTDSILQREGRHLAVNTYNFWDRGQHVRGFPALIAWLRSLGCDVKYSFEVRE